MIVLKSVTMKNFLSVGNVTQAVILDQTPLTLILGENRDLGGDGNKNGVGKTTIINAITYALYGSALTKIRLPNLVNKTNGKGLAVSLEFSKGNNEYRIERCRAPDSLKWFVNGSNPNEDDDAQGANRLTQEDIETVIGMDKVLFSNIVALNTFNEPFLSMSAPKQREMMELLLGMTKLSEKATALKEVIKYSKESLKEEEFRIKGIIDSNSTIEANINAALLKLDNWNASQESSIAKHALELEKFDGLDVDAEMAAHKDIEKIASLEAERSAIQGDISSLTAEVRRISKDKEQYLKDKKRTEDNKTSFLREKDNFLTTISRHTKAIEDLGIKKKELEVELYDLEEKAKNVEDSSTCPTCSQHVHGDQHANIVARALEKVSKCKLDITRCDSDVVVQEEGIVACRDNAKESQVSADNCDEEVLVHINNAARCDVEIKELTDGIDALNVSLDTIKVPAKPKTFYGSIVEVYEHKAKVDMLAKDLENELSKVNPYLEQEEVLRNAIQVVDYSEIEKITSMREHQDFLLKLLTNKDSFIRKKIIDQNLAFLNDRLRHYLETIGLPHRVIFNPNLDVSISEYGQELDFDNLSRGEKTRLILSLSWAFRDVYEAMNGHINLLFVDEMLDSGLDLSGTTATLDALRMMAHSQNKNVMLISHREELVGKVDHILTVCKENGFTRIESSEL